jgi:signal transduction histidine kinase
VQISVSDTGIGIPTEEQALIFDEFARVRRSSANRQGQGSGLGLAIAKRIVEAHEGNISVNSVPGQGSTFTFTLPVRQRISTAVSA